MSALDQFARIRKGVPRREIICHLIANEVRMLDKRGVGTKSPSHLVIARQETLRQD